MRHLISLKEQSKKDILEILDLAKKIKAKRKAGEQTNYLPNKTLVMLFQKTSTRTRLSFETAMTQLGGHAIFLDARTSQMTLMGVDFSDEIKAIMRFGDALMFRALKAADAEKAASYNVIPVIDACSEKYHPAQTLADLLTMSEYAGGLEKIEKVVWLGMENNVSNTLKLACAKLGILIAVVAPQIDQKSIDEELNEQANKTGLVSYTPDIKEALSGASFVHTDTWLNMEFFSAQSGPASGGKREVKPEYKKEFEKRKKAFAPYQLSAKLIDSYAPEAKIMHCMPCHVGYEITRDAIDHKNSVILDQAENRIHAQKGILTWLLERGV